MYALARLADFVMKRLGLLITTGLLVALWVRAPRAVSSPPEEPESAFSQLIQPVIAPRRSDTLRMVRIIGGSDAFGRIEDLSISDQWIVVIDAFADKHIFLVERATGVVVDSMGGRGRGPGEFLAPKSLDLDVDGGKPRVWIYDFQNARLSLHDLTLWRDKPVRMVRTQAGLFQPMWIGDTLVANGLFAAELLRFYVPDNASTRVVRAAGHTPFPDVTSDVALHLNRNALAIDPARERIALAFLYVSRLHFYDRSGRLLRALAGPKEITPRYRVVPDPVEGMNRFLREAKTRFSYLDVVATAQHVYSLFSGRSREDFQEQAFAATELHVFTWEGELVGVWTLAEEVYGIALDQASGSLYGIRALPFPSIVEFEPLRRQS